VAKCTKNIEHLASTIAAAELDSLIIIGDDRKEQYHDKNMPSVLVYTGMTIKIAPSSYKTEGLRKARNPCGHPGFATTISI
jgi:hypothetical protein